MEVIHGKIRHHQCKWISLSNDSCASFMTSCSHKVVEGDLFKYHAVKRHACSSILAQRNTCFLFDPVAQLLHLDTSSSTTWYKIEVVFGSKGDDEELIGAMCKSTVLASLLHAMFTSVTSILILCTTRFLL